METREIKITCPNCEVVNDYEIQKVELIGDCAEVTFYCACGCRFHHTYALVYLGGRTDDTYFDRDNLTVNR